MNNTVKYWKKIEDGTILEPFAVTKSGVNRYMSDNENWCPTCIAVVEYQNRLLIHRLTKICPFCASETKSKC
jgi:hypothetical protein